MILDDCASLFICRQPSGHMVEVCRTNASSMYANSDSHCISGRFYRSNPLTTTSQSQSSSNTLRVRESYYAPLYNLFYLNCSFIVLLQKCIDAQRKIISELEPGLRIEAISPCAFLRISLLTSEVGRRTPDDLAFGRILRLPHNSPAAFWLSQVLAHQQRTSLVCHLRTLH